MGEVPGFYVSQLSRHILWDCISSCSCQADKSLYPRHSFPGTNECSAVSPLFPKLLAVTEAPFGGVFQEYFPRRPCVDRHSENYDIQFSLASRILRSPFASMSISFWE